LSESSSRPSPIPPPSPLPHPSSVVAGARWE
jgi:hypothetical protein